MLTAPESLQGKLCDMFNDIFNKSLVLFRTVHAA